MATHDLTYSINPTTEDVLATFPQATPEDIDRALSDTSRAFQQWRSTSFAERAALMRQAVSHSPSMQVPEGVS